MTKTIVSYLLFLEVFLQFSCSEKKEIITILSWAGYNEPEIVNMIQEKIGPEFELNFILYTGGEDMLRKFETNKDLIDLVVLDAEYGKILYEKNEIQKIDLNSNQIISNNLKDYYPKFLPVTNSDSTKSVDQPPMYDKEGNAYCLIVRWGTVAIVSDTTDSDKLDKLGYNALLEKEYKNKIVIFDWYLPNMGIFSLIYLKNRKIDMNPCDLSRDQVTEMYNEVMQPLKANVQSFHSELGMVITSVYDKNVKMVPGIGEWAIGNNYINGDKSRNWYIPKGNKSIIWIESLAIPKHVKGTKKKVVLKILELFSTPKLQHELAWRKAYTSHVPNSKAYNLMTVNQKSFLRHDSLSTILENSYYRKVPIQQHLNLWIDLWTKFKN